MPTKNTLEMSEYTRLLKKYRYTLCYKFPFTYAHFYLMNFILISGMPLYQAIHILKKQDRIVKGVQVWYNDQVSEVCYTDI